MDYVMDLSFGLCDLDYVMDLSFGLCVCQI
jgi:hypothetical protein